MKKLHTILTKIVYAFIALFLLSGFIFIFIIFSGRDQTFWAGMTLGVATVLATFTMILWAIDIHIYL